MGFISFGKITKPHGLAGEVKLLPHSRSTESFSELTKLFIETKNSDTPEEFNILNLRIHKNTAIIKLDSIDTFEKAESLRGTAVYVDESELGDLDDDEYYFFELVGLRVYTDDNIYIGTVEEIMERAIQNVLVIKNEEKEILIPIAEPFIKKVDLEQRVLFVTPLEGMLD